MRHLEEQPKTQSENLNLETRVVESDDSPAGLRRQISKLAEDLTEFRRYHDDSRTMKGQSQSDDIVNLVECISKYDTDLRETRASIKLLFIRIHDQHEHSTCTNTKISAVTKNQRNIEDRISRLEKAPKSQSGSIHDLEARLVVLDKGFTAHSSQLGKDLEKVRESQVFDARGKLEERLKAVEKRFAQIDALMNEAQGESIEQLRDEPEISTAVEVGKDEEASEKDEVVDEESDVEEEVLELPGQPLENESKQGEKENTFSFEIMEGSKGGSENSVEAAPEAPERSVRNSMQVELPTPENVDLGETY